MQTAGRVHTLALPLERLPAAMAALRAATAPVFAAKEAAAARLQQHRRQRTQRGEDQQQPQPQNNSVRAKIGRWVTGSGGGSTTTAADESSYVFDGGVSAFESSPLGGLVATTVSDLKQAMTVTKPHRWKLDSRKILNSRRPSSPHPRSSPIGTERDSDDDLFGGGSSGSMKSLLCDPLALVQELLTEALALAAIMNASPAVVVVGSSRKRSRSRSRSQAVDAAAATAAALPQPATTRATTRRKKIWTTRTCRAAGASYVSSMGCPPKLVDPSKSLKRTAKMDRGRRRPRRRRQGKDTLTMIATTTAAADTSSSGGVNEGRRRGQRRRRGRGGNDENEEERREEEEEEARRKCFS